MMMIVMIDVMIDVGVIVEAVAAVVGVAVVDVDGIEIEMTEDMILRVVHLHCDVVLGIVHLPRKKKVEKLLPHLQNVEN